MAWTLALHGGAGLISPHSLDRQREMRAREGMARALDAGAQVLRRAGTALDAVEAAVRALEVHPSFNAGKAAVYAADGTQIFDASIMDGRDRACGAVCGVRHLAHPISAARLVMDRTDHVLFAGIEAQRWLHAQGAETATHAQLFDRHRFAHLRRARQAQTVALDHELEDPRTGTVGAVARDVHGHLAAATSTGGMANKPPARVGDSALIGAGTWADDATCAVSATGHGERFIQGHVAARVADLMELAGLTVDEAARRVVHDELPRRDGRGGLIAVDARGHVALPFNTGGMYRAWVDHEGTGSVDIWSSETS